MPERPGKCYRKVQRAYTRMRYVKRLPQSKIRKFAHGDPSSDYGYELRLVATSSFQVLSRALESARISALAQLRTGIPVEKGNYFFEVVPYPHQIVRRHAMASVRKAERLQKGMRLAFGKPHARAAIIKTGDTMLRLRVNGDGLDTAKYAMKIAKLKLPSMTKIVIEKVEKAAE